MRPICLLLLGVQLAYAVQHSMKYILTGTSGVDTFPEYTSVGMVDDIPFVYFDSNIKRMIPKTKWIKENEGEDYWNMESTRESGFIPVFKVNIQTLKERFNQTQGIHVNQVMYVCELEDDGTTRGYRSDGYDGEDFISLDMNTLTWTAANPKAFITKIKWDANKAIAEQTKSYLENTCIEGLKKYVSYGKDILERKDAPQVSLLQKDSTSPVICHATGFYPKNIMMTWKKNNEDLYEDVELSSTLPNEDGSYQKSIILSVNPEEWKKNPDIYRCVVQHVGAGKEILLNKNNIKTNTDSNNLIAIVIGCVVALALLAAIIGFIVWKKSNGYKKANASDTDSENSGQQLPQANAN